MNYKKIMLSVLVSMVIHQTVMPMDANEGAKAAIKGASDRAFWGWVKARSVPVVAGAAMVTIPPALILLGFMGGIDGRPGRSQKVFEGAIAAGYIIGIASVPAGVGLLARQGFLVARDVNYYHKITNSTARLNIQHLPQVAQIQGMNNHHQLLRATQTYINATGNGFERALINTRGLRGYKNN
jgi:hypothetical protein